MQSIFKVFNVMTKSAKLFKSPYKIIFSQIAPMKGTKYYKDIESGKIKKSMRIECKKEICNGVLGTKIREYENRCGSFEVKRLYDYLHRM